MIDKKYLYIGGAVLALGGVLYMRSRSAQEEAPQEAAVSSFPIASMGGYSGGGGGGFSIAPAAGTGGIDLAALTGGGAMGAGGGLGGGTGGSNLSMYDYMVQLAGVQAKSDLDLSNAKYSNAATMQNQYYSGELNLAQNSSLTYLGQSLTNGGSISLTSDKNGASSLTINKNASFADQQTLLKQSQDKAFVSSLYDMYSLHKADSGGLAYWTNALSNGTGYAELTNQFKASVSLTQDAMNPNSPAFVGPVKTAQPVPVTVTVNKPTTQAPATVTPPTTVNTPTQSNIVQPAETMTYTNNDFVGAMPARPAAQTQPQVLPSYKTTQLV